METADPVQSLVALGFTGLEAEVYAHLLQESPATGYRVAQAIGKPAANTYKAIESLAAKGAVLVDEGTSRLCRAVPAAELLGQLDRAFQERRARARAALAELKAPPEDDRVYQLRVREQVLERARTMLARARAVAILDIFPAPLAELRPDLERAAARGLQVMLKVFEPVTVAGATVILNPRGPDVIARYPGQWLLLFIDGAEFLAAFFTPDGRDVHQAVWSGSAYLSWIFHCALAGELIAVAVIGALAAGADPEELRAALRPFTGSRTPGGLADSAEADWTGCLSRFGRLFDPAVPGYQELLQRFSAPPQPFPGDGRSPGESDGS